MTINEFFEYEDRYATAADLAQCSAYWLDECLDAGVDPRKITADQEVRALRLSHVNKTGKCFCAYCVNKRAFQRIGVER